MANTAYDPKVGQRVYKCFRPMNAGVILEVIPQPARKLIYKGAEKHPPYQPPPKVRVLWVNGEETTVESIGLMDFDSLIEDHRKKLQTHTDTAAKLKALQDEEALKNGVPF